MRYPGRVITVALAVLATLVAGGLTAGPNAAAARAARTTTRRRRPRARGTVTYGLDAPTTGFCLPRAQLAVAGITIVQAVYDTLVAPDENGHMVPYLAQTVTPNSTYDEWTIRLRPHVRFHDGSPLNAAAVKENVDAWRTGGLSSILYGNMSAVSVVDDRTLVIHTKTPWVALPTYLYADGRAGIVAPGQLRDDATCGTHMIGTGPFRVKRFDPVSGDVDVVRNADYWRRGYPRLKGIRFRIQSIGAQRVNGLQGGDFDIIDGSSGKDLAAAEHLGTVQVNREPPGFRPVADLLLNVKRGDLRDAGVRRAISLAVDRRVLNQTANDGAFELASQPFDRRVAGYLAQPPTERHNPRLARRLVRAYVRRHGNVRLALQPTAEPTDQAVAVDLKQQLENVGISVTVLPPVDQATLLSKAIGSQLDAFMWQSFPGSDPDAMWVWLHGGSPVNFNGTSDARVDRDLEHARGIADTHRRRDLYRDLTKRVLSEHYDVWGWYTTWFVAHSSHVHGIAGPNLPSRDGTPSRVRPAKLLGGTPQLLGIWTDH